MLEFIQRDDVTFEQANKVVVKALGVLQPYKYTKDKLILIVKEFLNNWEGSEHHPIFLQQTTPDFKLQDITRFW